MFKIKIKNNNGPARKNMRSIFGGFTLVETMFAVMILTFTIVSMMTVVSSSLFSARYARNEITANYLLQEVIDFVRNERDTTAFLQSGSNPTEAWDNFIFNYRNCAEDVTGCRFDVLSASSPGKCTADNSQTGETGCPTLMYDPSAQNTSYYTASDNVDIGADGKAKIDSGFKRKIVIKQNAINLDEVDVIVTVSWKNGGLPMSRSLTATLMKWQ